MNRRLSSLSLLSAALLALAPLAGCSGEASDGQKEAHAATAETMPMDDSGVPRSSADIDSMTAQLAEQGLLTGTPQPMAVDMYGAKSGVRYTDQSADIYDFDPTAPELARAREGESIEMNCGMDVSFIPSAVNGNLVLHINPENTNPQPLIDAFKNAD